MRWLRDANREISVGCFYDFFVFRALQLVARWRWPWASNTGPSVAVRMWLCCERILISLLCEKSQREKKQRVCTENVDMNEGVCESLFVFLWLNLIFSRFHEQWLHHPQGLMFPAMFSETCWTSRQWKILIFPANRSLKNEINNKDVFRLSILAYSAECFLFYDPVIHLNQIRDIGWN